MCIYLFANVFAYIADVTSLSRKIIRSPTATLRTSLKRWIWLKLRIIGPLHKCIGEVGLQHILIRDRLPTYLMPSRTGSNVMARDSGSLHRNFQGYTTHAETDLLGFGVSAISHVGHTYTQNCRELTAWADEIDAGHIPVF